CALYRFLLLTPPPPTLTLFPYTTLFRSDPEDHRPLAALAGQTLSCELRLAVDVQGIGRVRFEVRCALAAVEHVVRREVDEGRPQDRKSTRLNSSHVSISYAVFCLKKKKK